MAQNFSKTDELMTRYVEMQRKQNQRNAIANNISDDDRRFTSRHRARVGDHQYQVSTSTRGRDFIGYPSQDPKSRPKLDETKVGIAIVAAFAIAGVGYVTGINIYQDNAFHEQTEIVQTVDLPDSVYGNIDLDIQKNGEALFVDQNGNRFAGYNGEKAQDVANIYAEPQTEENSGPTHSHI